MFRVVDELTSRPQPLPASTAAVDRHFPTLSVRVDEIFTGEAVKNCLAVWQVPLCFGLDDVCPDIARLVARFDGAGSPLVP